MPNIERTCPICGTVFQVQAWERRQHCSRRCAGRTVSLKQRGRVFTPDHHAKLAEANRKAAALRQLPLVTFTCLQCTRTVAIHDSGTASRHRTGSQPRRFCTLQCRTAYKRLHPEEHPRWRGGSFSDFGKNWIAQRRLARQRDQDTCRRCGATSTGRALSVHHLRPRREFGDAWEAANHLDNLITLCTRCHRLTDWEWDQTRTVDLSVFLPVLVLQ